MKTNVLTLLTTVGALALAAPAPIAASRPPNILLITADDLGMQLGCYGEKQIRTPHLDRLAREGMKFTRAFSKPVCSPSRAMQLTGQYTHRLGIPDFIPYGSPAPVLPDNGLTKQH